MTEKRQRIAVRIPCKNEALTISDTIDGIQKELPSAAVYVYDNNSTDETAAVAKSKGVFTGEEARNGKGCVVRAMLRDIDAECYVLIDGDNTYDTGQLKKMCHMVLSKKADMVIGRRNEMYAKKLNIHSLGNRLVNVLVNRIYKTEHKDIMSGLRAFNNRTARMFLDVSDGFEIETEMAIIATRKKLKVEYVKTHYRDRVKGSCSKIRTLSDGYKILKVIISSIYGKER